MKTEELSYGIRENEELIISDNLAKWYYMVYVYVLNTIRLRLLKSDKT
jgi:hypothetical protein